MSDELRDQINDIIEGEIQNGINDYIEQQGKGFKGQELKVNVSQDEIDKIAKSFSLNNKKQEENFKDALKVTCRKFTKEKTGKRPITNINLVRI